MTKHFAAFLFCLFLSAPPPADPPKWLDLVPPPRELGGVSVRYVIDTETEVTLDGEPAAMADVPKDAVVTDLKVDVEKLRVVHVAFTTKGK